MKLTTFTLLLAACLSQAATLTNVVVTTRFPIAGITNTPLYRTYGHLAPVSNSGVFTDIDGAQLYTSHIGAIAAVQTNVDAPTVALLYNIDYELSFTVQDPLSNGYSLTLGHNIVGFLNAAYDFDNSLPGSSVAARYQGITVEFFGPNNNWVPISNLELATNYLARANEDDPLATSFLLDGASATAFVLSGTRDFRFRFNFDMQVAAGEAAAGEAAIRLGLDPCTAIPTFVQACTPGIDGTPIEQLGHFATVRLDSFQGPVSNEVPEPATLLTTAAAIAIALRSKLRR
jgi:hypothetical protein